MTQASNRHSGGRLAQYRLAAVHVIKRADEATALRQLDHPACHVGHHRLTVVFVMADIALRHPDGLGKGGLRKAKLGANGLNRGAHFCILV